MFDVAAGREEAGGKGASLRNWEEVKLMMTMLNYLYDTHKPESVGVVAIISPYRAQVCSVVPAHRYSVHISGLVHIPSLKTGTENRNNPYRCPYVMPASCNC
jgi:hypothetical protein